MDSQWNNNLHFNCCCSCSKGTLNRNSKSHKRCWNFYAGTKNIYYSLKANDGNRKIHTITFTSTRASKWTASGATTSISPAAAVAAKARRSNLHIATTSTKN
jgi:hypothetical protein